MTHTAISPHSHHSAYVGRFAPSPSGSLHFGSLITALASYLDAKHHKGTWLVRMEDIDEPRCVKGADAAILTTLERHHLQWDGDVLYQSQQHPRYQEKVNQLLQQGAAYYCRCTRKQIKAMGGRYNGECRTQNIIDDSHVAVRMKLDNPLMSFDDGMIGHVDAGGEPEDCVIKRRDGLFSYHLVVALDDAYQGVTHIVRGRDLLDVTPLHKTLYAALGCPPVTYCHVPVAAVAAGRKLSKQNHAKPVNNKNVMTNLLHCLQFLGLANVMPLDSQHYSSPESLISAAISHWDRKLVPNTAEIIVDSNESTYYSQPL